jgi:hypothetical protein
MGISLSSRLLDNFQDEFLVYVFSEGEGVRLGINILPKDAIKAFADMKIDEKLLVNGLTPFFLGEVAKGQTPSFQESQYGGKVIRYINLNEQKNLSIDYFVSQNRLIIATSWGVAKSIIDKGSSLNE